MSEYTPEHGAGLEETPVQPAETPKPWVSNRTYDALVWIAQIFLPTMATLYAALGALWGFPKVEAVLGTIVAVDTALGGLLSLSKRQYEKSGAKYDGDVNVETTPEGKKLSLALNGDPYDLDKQKEVVFKVNPS